jgi:3-(3-hydroxy-phenyl)propionate hydroxylase
MSKAYDVAIIGFGPTGATLAALLGTRGLRVAVFDRYREIYPKPRAVGMDHEVMRVLQQIGVSHLVEATSRDYPPTIYQGVDGRTIQEIVPMAPPYVLSWPPASSFDQPALEANLRAKVEEDANTDIFLEHEVVDAVEGRGCVELTVKSTEGELIQTFAAGYVVGCDGAQSPTRRRAGITMENYDFEEQWLVIDAVIDESHADNLPSTNVQYCYPQRPCSYIVCPGLHRRWELKVMPGEYFDKDIPHDVLYPLLSRWLTPENARIWRAAAYRFKAVIAQRWSHGRIFIAGDAAHQMPPFLGQGMCQGVRDAANLEWKLASVVRSRSPSRLLDTYQIERRPHVAEVTRAVVALGSIIGELDLATARARDERILADQGGAVRLKVRQDLIPGISHGRLLHESPGSGRTFPQPFIWRNGRRIRMDEVIGSNTTVVCRVAPEPKAAREMIDLLRQVDGVLATIDSTASGDVEDMLYLDESEKILSAWFEKHASAVALIRPDHYVYGTTREIGQAANLVRSFLDALQCPPLVQEIPREEKTASN